jgi:FKBP-type peptidyl-prolyl cis-trans isomerase 2
MRSGFIPGSIRKIEGVTKMDDEKLCLISIALVIVMFAGLAGMTYVDEEGWPWENEEEEKEVIKIQEGDEVTVDYTGRFLGAGGELGPVFDTSEPEVARNESIPKSQSFRMRPTYDDLTFTVGSGKMIKGFEEAVIGKKEGESFTVTIPPEDGYGEANPGLIQNIDSTQTIPLRETLQRDDFMKIYPAVGLETTDSFIHPFWRWDVHIVSYDPQTVTIWHEPVYNKEYQAFPWNTTVTDVSTQKNTITLQHDISEITYSTSLPYIMMVTYDPLWAEDAMGAMQNEPIEGFVTSKGGVITIDFNTEVTGKTLVFYITINSIKRE